MRACQSSKAEEVSSYLREQRAFGNLPWREQTQPCSHPARLYGAVPWRKQCSTLIAVGNTELLERKRTRSSALSPMPGAYPAPFETHYEQFCRTDGAGCFCSIPAPPALSFAHVVCGDVNGVMFKAVFQE